VQDNDKPKFTPGRNIAMKVPSHEFEQVVEFYRDLIGLPEVERDSSGEAFPSVAFEFGDKRLWVDKIDHLSQAEIWLEIESEDIEGAANYFEGLGVARRDKIEPLPEGFKGFWIANPAGIIHLVSPA